MEQINLKLTFKDSKLNGLTLNEPVDIQILDKLIHSDLLKTTFNNPMCKIYNTNEKQQLLKYKKLIKNGKAKVEYNKSKGIKWGRVMPLNGCGLFSIRRELRHTLAKNHFVDIDVVNCHPVLLYQICKANNIPCEHLEDYVFNRPQHLERIMKKYNVNKDTAKNLFIRSLYLGLIENWLSDNKIENKTHDDFVVKLQTELNHICHRIILHNPDIDKAVKKNKEKNNKQYKIGSSLSYYLQEYENQILETIYEYCNKMNYINSNECVLCADGLMIPKSLYKPQLLEELKIIINEKFGFNLEFIMKEMNQDYLSILDDHQLEDDDNENDYESVKFKFEKTNFKLLNPISYVTIDTNKELIIRKKTDFLSVYENLHYEKLQTDDEGNKKIIKKQFVPEWLKDEKIKTYDRIDFLPKLEAPQNIYNTFTQFEADKLTNNKNLFFSNSLMYKHIKNLCGNDELCYDYFIKFLAQKVQKPTQITRTSIVLQSNEGCGKDTFLNWFGNSILGKKYYVNTESIDSIFGRFNGLIQDKVLIVINETSGKDTFQLSDKIKASITNELNTIEKKGYELFTNTNCISYIFLSNNKNPVKVSENDRRFVIFECNGKIANNHEYFTALNKEIESKEYDKIFYDLLMTTPIDGYDFTNNRPKTNAYNNIKEATKSPIISFYEDLIFKFNESFLIGGSEFYSKFTTFLKSNNFNYEYNNTKFGIELKQYETYIIKTRTKKGIYYNIKINELKNHLITTKQIEPIQDDVNFEDGEEEEKNDELIKEIKNDIKKKPISPLDYGIN